MTSGSSSIWMEIINNKTDTRGLLSLEKCQSDPIRRRALQGAAASSPPLGDLELFLERA
jgi:hypothetical protein